MSSKKIVYKGARKAAAQKDKAGAVQMTAADEPPGLINGMQAQSSYEWNIARALWAHGWKFDYQVQVSGGWSLRGGQSLDFLVHTVPNRTPLPVDGGYWHRNRAKTEINDGRLMTALQHRGYSVNRPIHALDKDAAKLSDAMTFIATKFGRA